MPETKMDEKQAQPQPAPGAPSASKGNTFLLVARIWVALMGLSWAGTLTFLLTGLSFMGPASVPIFRAHVRPGALAVGVLVGAALVFLIFKKLSGQMTYVRPGLGRSVRLSAFGGIGALTLFGAYALYMAPPINSIWWMDIAGPLTIFGKSLGLKPILFAAAAACLTFMSIVHLVLNREKAADFLIETEGEIKKVSWPARKEYVGSAMIVVLVVAVVSMFLHYVDAGLSWLMQKWGVGF
jgi:preprotein translocase SecE subunit